jgi:hypothetical protein
MPPKASRGTPFPTRVAVGAERALTRFGQHVIELWTISNANAGLLLAQTATLHSIVARVRLHIRAHCCKAGRTQQPHGRHETAGARSRGSRALATLRRAGLPQARP